MLRLNVKGRSCLKHGLIARPALAAALGERPTTP